MPESEAQRTISGSQKSKIWTILLGFGPLMQDLGQNGPEGVKAPRMRQGELDRWMDVLCPFQGS